MSLRRSLLPLTFLFALSASLAACAPRTSGDTKAPTVGELRKNAEEDSKQTSAWFLAELLAPDGSPARAKQARSCGRSGSRSSRRR
jgi:hypothetical protein